jgi:hypothetical protein
MLDAAPIAAAFANVAAARYFPVRPHFAGLRTDRDVRPFAALSGGAPAVLQQ